uniref:Uncharacterized protein n=1 Tax=Arundo donax TaxID=35708 RepID=A0A0A8Z198_ARUDO
MHETSWMLKAHHVQLLRSVWILQFLKTRWDSNRSVFVPVSNSQLLSF